MISRCNRVILILIISLVFWLAQSSSKLYDFLLLYQGIALTSNASILHQLDFPLAARWHFFHAEDLISIHYAKLRLWIRDWGRCGQIWQRRLLIPTTCGMLRDTAIVVSRNRRVWICLSLRYGFFVLLAKNKKVFFFFRRVVVGEKTFV